jgi:hypothetical protein|nr:MAG TPA: tail collar fiber protein [Caudoviricetes sp.]
MAVFKDTTITDNGRTLIADALANNKQITFTRMITSSKSYEDSTDVSKLISVDEIKQSVNMTRINQEGTKVRLNAIFTNSAVNTSYKIQTIGLYAKIGTGNEILYSVTRAKEPDTMPATNGINLATVEIDLITEINNSNGATILMNPSSLVTTSSLIMELEKITGLEFGGNIQDVSNKTKGKFYYDNVTKFYYECIENTNLTYNDVTKFRAISNKPISDKVEGLLEIGNNHIKFSNGIILGFGTCIASPAGTMNNYGTNLGGIVSLVLTVNGGAYIASGETISGTAFKARTNAPGSVSASYLAIGKWR